MAINWGMAGRAQNDLFQYFQMGQQIGQGIVDRKVNKALGRVLTGGMQTPGSTPGGTPSPGGMTPGIGDQVSRDKMAGSDMQTIARHNPQLAMQIQQRQLAMQKQRQEVRRAQVEDVARLFDGVTPENYSQRIAAARQLGIDVSSVPQNYDPAWVAQNKAIFGALSGKDNDLSGIARELVDAGYQPNTPEFKQAMAGVINNKYAAEYVDEQGNTRRRSALNLNPGAPMAPQPQQSAAAQEPITFDMYMSARQGLGPQGSLEWITGSNIPVRVATPQQARQLPRGTRIILPDGSEGVVP